MSQEIREFIKLGIECLRVVRWPVAFMFTIYIFRNALQKSITTPTQTTVSLPKKESIMVDETTTWYIVEQLLNEIDSVVSELTDLTPV